MRINFKNTSYDFGFKGKNQMPLFMISKEYYVNNELDFAKVIFEIKGRDCRKQLKEFFNRPKTYWNNDFDMERNINGKNIIVGQQDFENGTIMVKDENRKILCCPMFSDNEGNIYFIYDGVGVYISEYMGEFELSYQ